MAHFDPANFVDLNPDYWMKPENARFANNLSHFEHARMMGQLRHEQLVRPYAIPKSQMVQLRENPGGIPVWKGQQTNVLPMNYQAPRIMGMPQDVPNPAIAASSVNREISPAELHGMMSQRMMSQGASPTQMIQGGIVNSPPQGAAGPRLVTLIEGHVFYRALQVSGFSATMPIVRTGGTIAGLKGPVELKEIVRAYNADGLARIDAGSLQQDSGRHIQLAAIQSFGTNGMILVPLDAIVENGYGRQGSQQLLRDSHVGQQSYNAEQMAIMRNQQQQAQMQQRQQHMMPQHYRQQQPDNNSRGIIINDQASRELLRKRGLLKG